MPWWWRRGGVIGLVIINIPGEGWWRACCMPELPPSSLRALSQTLLLFAADLDGSSVTSACKSQRVRVRCKEQKFSSKAFFSVSSQNRNKRGCVTLKTVKRELGVDESNRKCAIILSVKFGSNWQSRHITAHWFNSTRPVDVAPKSCVDCIPR